MQKMKAKPWWQDATTSPVSRDRARAEVDISIPRGQRGAWTGQGEFRLIGHYDYQSTIATLCATLHDPRGEHAPITIRIVREQTRIKATTINGATLGFFSKKDTRNYRSVLAALAERFAEIRCAGSVQ